VPPEPAARPSPAGDRNGAPRRVEQPEPPSRAAVPDRNAPPRGGLFEAPPPVGPAVPEPVRAEDEGGGGNGGGGGGWLSNLLTRASRDVDESSNADDRGGPKAARPPAPKDPRAPGEDDRGLRRGIESADSLSVDIARMIDHEAAADLWERYNRGERNVFSRRLYTMQGRKAFDEMRRRYKADREFRQAVDRYVGEFDRLLGEIGHEEGGPILARNYITSEAGKVYTMLAHAAGRFE
jgi:hypothetical protein